MSDTSTATAPAPATETIGQEIKSWLDQEFVKIEHGAETAWADFLAFAENVEKDVLPQLAPLAETAVVDAIGDAGAFFAGTTAPAVIATATAQVTGLITTGVADIKAATAQSISVAVSAAAAKLKSGATLTAAGAAAVAASAALTPATPPAA